MTSEADLDPFVSCPFNIIHRVPLSRLQSHIVKCEKNYPGFKVCPYNATHRLPPEEIKDHVQKCPSRAAIFPDNTPELMGDITKPKPILQKQYLPETDPDFEEWDD